jgi:hypothetical protein
MQGADFSAGVMCACVKLFIPIDNFLLLRKLVLVCGQNIIHDCINFSKEDYYV